MKHARSQRGFLLVEAAVAIVLLSVVTFTAVNLTANAMYDTNWTTRITLADAYLDREAALMRRLPPTALQARGFAGTTTNNVPLAYYTNRADPIFQADSVTRQVSQNNNTYTYTVTLNMTIRSTTTQDKVYTKQRTVQRYF
ncbi:MAG: prepilin-type N-terminal cleavage/methylation domain-containing protein [Verrucomicrobium sp.]|nr:prepilin-type N-terminal cleavage/methylation domain-containing protein [Verrucomicrobium sp.]